MIGDKLPRNSPSSRTFSWKRAQDTRTSPTGFGGTDAGQVPGALALATTRVTLSRRKLANLVSPCRVFGPSMETLSGLYRFGWNPIHLPSRPWNFRTWDTALRIT